MSKLFKVLALTLFAALALSLWLSPPTTGQNRTTDLDVDGETGSTAVALLAPTEALTTDMDAKTDDLFNNFGARGTPINECVADAVPPTARGNGRFEDNKFIFEEEETVADGLGPTYNDVGCVTCHQAVDTGAFGQQMEFRAGHITNGNFVDNPGGQLIHTRGTDSDVVEHITTAENVRSFRVVLQALGDGFIECISNTDLQNNVAAEPFGQRGTLTAVPVVEANNALRIGRFGWKGQHASLLSFSGDAYLNEMGITNKFDGFGGRSSSAPDAGTNENPASTAEGVIQVTGPPFDPVVDPEDDGGDVLAFADFMAATRAPGRQNPISAAATRGDPLFNQVGCNVCHTRTFTTATAGTLINGGAFTVPAALGNKIIHPFSDFALHNVGTGDGIVQNAGQSTANQIKTPPLWGIRARNRFMHDGLSVNVSETIQRHAGQATAARNAFNALTAQQRSDLLFFVLSL
ncbi:MAG TPA: di-heme oxidoredictase family protein [Pyrinomonadaceae bacterium]|nr:di-heme oxidoredictase family protein [Pyrinomonadaceae bacterium]